MSAQPAASRKGGTFNDSDDAVLGRALELTSWAKTNIRLIVIGTLVLALFVGGLIYYRVYRDNREQRAASEFVRIEQTAASGNAALATRDLQTFVNRYEGTAYADEARIALAQAHLGQDSAAKAVTALRGAEARVADSPVGPQAALLLAAAQEAANQRDAAIRTYLAVAEDADLKMFRVRALNGAATLRVEAGDHAGAAELYRQLVELQEEGTLDEQLFLMRLSEAEAAASAGAAAPAAPAAAPK